MDSVSLDAGEFGDLGCILELGGGFIETFGQVLKSSHSEPIEFDNCKEKNSSDFAGTYLKIFCILLALCERYVP